MGYVETMGWEIKRNLGPIQKIGELTVKLLHISAQERLVRGIEQLKNAGFDIPLYPKNPDFLKQTKINEKGPETLLIVKDRKKDF